MREGMCLVKIETTNKMHWNQRICKIMGLPGLIILSRAHQLLREIHCLHQLVQSEIQTTRDSLNKVSKISPRLRGRSMTETTIWIIQILSIWDISTWWIPNIIICKPILQVSPHQLLDKRDKMKIMVSSMEQPKSHMMSHTISNLVSFKKSKGWMLSRVSKENRPNSRRVMSNLILSNRDSSDLLLLASTRFLRQLLPLHHYLRGLNIIEPYRWIQASEKKSLIP